MKSIAVCIITSLLALSGNAQPVVVQDIGRCVLWDSGPTLNPWGSYDLGVKIGNPEQVQENCTIVLGFVMTDGTQIDVPQVQYQNGFDTLFGSTPVYFVEQHGDTTVVGVTVSAADPGRGLPISTDTIPYLSFSVGGLPPYGSDGEYLVVDTTLSNVYGGLQFGNEATPEWLGGIWYRIFTPPNCLLEFTNNPVYLSASMCAPIVYSFHSNTCLGDSAIVGYHLMSGPGQLDESSGVYSWTPGPADAGTTQEIVIEGNAALCRDEMPFVWGTGTQIQIQLNVVGENYAPQFASSQPRVFVVSSGQALTFQPAIDDPDPCTDYRFSYFWDSQQDPEPPGWLDSLTGEFHYEGMPSDTGLYHFDIVVNEAGFADTMGFYIYHFDSFTCGDINHSGEIEIADLTWLVSYIFQSGPPPVTLDAGNTDCQPGINVADLTYLVNFVFRNGPAPCDSCR